MDKSKVLYDKLYSDKLYTKSFDEFKNQFGTPEGQSKLFDKLSQEQLYTKSREEFTNQFFTPIQKKNPNQPTKPSSMVSPSPTKVQNTPLVSPSKSEEVGYLEDLWNRFRGSGAKALSSLMSIPSLAQNAAFDIIASATGKDEEFNKLPVSVKKDIRDLVKKSQSSTPVGKMSVGTEQAADYLNKKADKIYEKTIKQEGDVFTDINNFRKNPTAEGAGQVLSRALRSGVESLPYMGMMVLPGGLTTLGVSSAAQKRQEDISETGNIGIGNLLTAGAHGTAEAFFERYTQGILNRAGKLVAGNPVASKELASGIVKSIAKDFNVEGISEAATTAIQETADKLNKGEDIEIKPLLRKVADSYLLGGATGGGITAGAYGIKQFADKSAAGKNYILSKIMPADKKKELEKISNDRQALEFEKGIDTNPEVKSVIDGKISDLESQYNNIISEANTLYDNMSDDQIKEIITIDNDLDDNYNKAKVIIDDTTMDQDAKDLLLGDLLKKQNELKQQRDAIQKQATSQVPVQPETAVSGEVAKGEPETKPEVTTEEGQIQEIEARRQNELKEYEGRAASRFVKFNPEGENKELTEDEFNEIEEIIQAAIDNGNVTADKLFRMLSAQGYTYSALGSATSTLAYLKNRLNGKTNVKVGGNLIDNTNAKYDAEIEALKPKTGGMVQMAEQVEKDLSQKFDLTEPEAKGASIVIDKIVDTIASRTNKPKENVYENIVFEKGAQPIEKPQEVEVKTQEGPIDTEQKFDDAIANQVVSWKQFPEQTKGKEIAGRNKALTQAAKDLLDGKISNEEYRSIVEKESPIKPIETFFNPSTDAEVKSSLESNKVPLVNSVTEKGDTFIDPKTNTKFEIVSDKVGLRLDLPAYLNKNKWVVTIHADAKDTKTGKVSKDKPVSYTGVAKIKDVTFDYNPNLAAKIAKGDMSRETKFKMRGTLVPVQGNTIDEQNANAKKEVELIMNDPSWVQIGANPFRHSYFYSRSTGKPVVSADEVIQIGGLVFAKNPKEVNWKDERFQVTEKGKPVLGKGGQPILFQDEKGSVSIQDDGKVVITALTNPNVSTPLHEIAHVYEHYLTEQERQDVLDWAQTEEWNRDTSEKFARGFEKYLSDGVAPTAELGKIFEMFKEWLLNIYNGIKDSGIDIQLNENMQNIYAKMLGAEKPVRETPTVEEEVKSPFTQVKQGPQAKQKAVDQIEKALKRGRQLNQAVQGGISALRKTIAYEEANDVVREAMEREIRKDYGLKEKKAPTVKKLFPVKETKELVNTMTALKDQIKLEVKAAKGGAVAVQNAAKDLIGKIKQLGKIGKITPFQVSRLTKLFGKNLLSPKTFDAAVETATKIVENSQYAKRLEDAFKIRKKLKSIAKRETKFQADVIKAIKQFTKVDPSKVEKLGYYENLAMALLRATRPVSVDKTGEVIGREAAFLSPINIFSENEIAKQEELLKNALLDRYDYLVEEGKISSEMSYKDILNYVNSVEENPENEDSTKSDLVKEYTKQAFDDAVAEYEENIDNVDPEDRKLLDEFTSMDIEKLPLEKQIMAVDAMQNYLVNDITTNMQALLNPYKGATNAEANAKAGLKAQPIKVGLIGRLGVPGQYYSNIWGEYISKADSLLANAFRSSAKAIKFLKDSGFSGVVNGFVQGKKIANTFAKEYTDKYEKTKPNGQDFNTAYNTYERGIFAALYRSVLNGSEGEVKAEFDRQKNLLSETIDALENSGDKKLIKKAELYKQVYDKIKDAENIEDVKKVIDPINQDAVQTMVDFWKKFYPEFRKIASEVYNILLDEDVNYTPEMYEKILQEVSDDLLSKGSFRIGFDFVNTEKAGNLLKNNKVKTLPKSNGEVSRVRDYDFDLGNINALERTLVDIYTTPSVQQYLGYIGSDAFKQIFPDAGQRNLIKQRLNFNIDALRGKQNTYSPPAIKAFSNLVASLSKYGTRIGLGSFSSIFKQSLPMAANTVVNMGKDTPQFAAALQDYLANKDALDFLNKSGYGISLRGAEAQTSIDYAEKMIDKADLNKIESIANALSKTGDFYIENFLKKPDVAIANISWLAYYRKKLKDLGEDVDKINWETHKLNQEAADYAEFMVQDQQNMNVAELGGKLLASKNPAVKLARQLLFPFASYQFNLKDKNNRAMTILTSKNSNFEEKKEAMKSLSSGIVESIMFDAISAVVSSGLMSLAYASIGDEGEKEEKLKSLNEKLSWDFLKKLSATKILTEFVVPVAPQVDKITVDVANYLLDLVNPEDPKGKSKYKPKSAIGKQIKAKEEKMDDPFRFYSKESNFLDLVGGVPAIGAESLGQIWNDSKDAFTGEHKDKYGNVIKYNEEQKQLIMLSVLPKLLSSANLLPREALTYGKDLRKIIDEEAKRSPQNTKRKKKKFKGF